MFTLSPRGLDYIGIPLTELFFPELLRQFQGYRTFMSGKVATLFKKKLLLAWLSHVSRPA